MGDQEGVKPCPARLPVVWRAAGSASASPACWSRVRFGGMSAIGSGVWFNSLSGLQLEMRKGPLRAFSFELHARMPEATPTKNQRTRHKRRCLPERIPNSVKLYIEFCY
jgi:hypothetical protein